MSLPSREVWVEIFYISLSLTLTSVTSLTGSVGWNLLFKDGYMAYVGHFPHGKCGLKFTSLSLLLLPPLSLPSREVWVEIIMCHLAMYENWVTSLTGSVGWNCKAFKEQIRGLGHFPHGKCGLKLRIFVYSFLCFRSLPSREVWVEIQIKTHSGAYRAVTSLTGSVGWNLQQVRNRAFFFGHFPHGKCGLKSDKYFDLAVCDPSLPSREVWVEIKSNWRGR